MIEITSTEYTTRKGTSQRTGKEYSMNEQFAYMHRPNDPYPEKIKLTLDNGQAPYAAGNYDLHHSSFSVGRFGGIEVRPVLVPRPGEQNASSSRGQAAVSTATK
jgi:hypothetical protein